MTAPAYKPLSIETTEVVLIPLSAHVRLLAIEAAVRNAMGNSWDLYSRDLDEYAQDYVGCTVFDPADYAEIVEAMGE